jgi:hypothetical protein
MWRALLGILLLATTSPVLAALVEVDVDVDLIGNNALVATDYHAPAIATNTLDDHVLMAWQTDRAGAGYRIEIAGLTLASPPALVALPIILDSGAGDARYVAAAFNAVSEKYLVVWSEDNNTTADDAFEIWGQLVNRDFSVSGSPIQISQMGVSAADAAFDGSRPAVAAASNSGDFVVVWEGDDDAAGMADGQFEIYSRRVLSSGVATGSGNQRISHLTDGGGNGAFAPAIAFDDFDQEFLVVYEGDAAGGAYTPHVYFNFLQPDGSELDGGAYRDSQLDIGLATNGKNPDVAYDSRANDFLVVWDGGLFPPGGSFVLARRVLTNIGLSAVTQVNAGGFPQSNRDPRVAYNLFSDGYVVSWSGTLQPGPAIFGEYEIHARQLDSGGAVVGPPLVISTTGIPGDHTSEAVSSAITSSDRQKGLICMWSGSAETPYSFGLSSQFLELSVATSVPTTPLPKHLSMSAAPNPFNPATEISFAIPTSGQAKIAIYDAHGARVHTLLDESLSAGWHQRVWNGRDDRGKSVASGVYFARVVHSSGSKEQKLVLLK